MDRWAVRNRAHADGRAHLYRVVRALRIHEDANDVQKLLIARSILEEIPESR